MPTRGSHRYKKYFHVLPDKPNGYNHLGICISCKSSQSNINANELKITLTKKTCRNHLLNCKFFEITSQMRKNGLIGSLILILKLQLKMDVTNMVKLLLIHHLKR
jgi:predicted amidophosphoribosyltransferase